MKYQTQLTQSFLLLFKKEKKKLKAYPLIALQLIPSPLTFILLHCCFAPCLLSLSTIAFHAQLCASIWCIASCFCLVFRASCYFGLQYHCEKGRQGCHIQLQGESRSRLVVVDGHGSLRIMVVLGCES